MTITLSQTQRLIAAAGYLLALWLISAWITNSIPQAAAHATFWFYSGVLMIVLGKYVVEPYFTTPADAIVNGLALLISLEALSSVDQPLLLGFHALRIYAIGVMIVAVTSIATKDMTDPSMRLLGKAMFKVVQLFGKSTVMFSTTYLAASYSFFARPGHLDLYVTVLTLWVCLTFFDVGGLLIREISKFIGFVRQRPGEELGAAIGCENPLLYKVEVEDLARVL